MKTNACQDCRLKMMAPGASAHSAAVMFVGLSAKPETEALCVSTNTGRVIEAIMNFCSDHLRIQKCNAVRCAPLDVNGKLRYPSKRELNNCFPALTDEIEAASPQIVVPLGAQVARHLVERLCENNRFSGFDQDFRYRSYRTAHHIVLPIHHPSYIMIYRRKRLDEYVAQVGEQLEGLAR